MHWRQYAADSTAWALAVSFAALLRFDFRVSMIPWGSVLILIAAAVILQFVVGSILYTYQGRYRWGSFESLASLTLTVGIVATLSWVGNLFLSSVVRVPRSLILIAAPLALLLMFSARYLARASAEKPKGPTPEAIPIVLYGAGFVGEGLARAISTDPNSRYMLVAFLDDDPGKGRLRMHGVPVRGGLADLPRVAEETGAKKLVVAMARPSPEKLREAQAMAAASGMRVLLVPSMEEILKTGLDGGKLRKLAIEDLLGRPVVQTNVSEIAGYLNGKRVLVTGAGGSIGQQLCVEINKHGPSELMMLDRDETGLQETQIKLRGQGLLDSDEVVLADIRDADTLDKIFQERRPQVVFHAAALKHLPMLEQYPNEAWQTNVLGTRNVLQAADDVDVETFVNISTDKAANPISILGTSKRVAEQLTSWFGANRDARYLSVRFGNVIGSRGSMLPTFQRLIEEGKTLTVTHPDVTRYFMTIPEACQLVLQAGGIGRSGEVLILDMGEPVRILDIARQMIAISGKDIEIVFTGLRHGEKLDEILVSDHETEHRPFHPKISHADVQGVPPHQLNKDVWDTVARSEGEERYHKLEMFSRLLPN